jgi:hypothetical protein
MSWLFPRWDPDLSHDSKRTEIPEAGGWLYQVRDPNFAFSTCFVPDLVIWANAIGQATVKAQTAAQPVGVTLDFSRAHFAPQPKPGPK